MDDAPVPLTPEGMENGGRRERVMILDIDGEPSAWVRMALPAIQYIVSIVRGDVGTGLTIPCWTCYDNLGHLVW